MKLLLDTLGWKNTWQISPLMWFLTYIFISIRKNKHRFIVYIDKKMLTERHSEINQKNKQTTITFLDTFLSTKCANFFPEAFLFVIFSDRYRSRRMRRFWTRWRHFYNFSLSSVRHHLRIYSNYEITTFAHKSPWWRAHLKVTVSVL